MKDSHFKTPRTLDGCQFAFNCDPIEKPPQETHKNDKIVMTASILILVALGIVLVIWK